jgi:hypothetical protein
VLTFSSLSTNRFSLAFFFIQASMPGAVPSDLLAKEQQFILAGLEGEWVMMMFISIVIVSLMILISLAFHWYPSFLFLSSYPIPSSLAGVEYACLELMTADMVFKLCAYKATRFGDPLGVVTCSSLQILLPTQDGLAVELQDGETPAISLRLLAPHHYFLHLLLFCGCNFISLCTSAAIVPPPPQPKTLS